MCTFSLVRLSRRDTNQLPCGCSPQQQCTPTTGRAPVPPTRANQYQSSRSRIKSGLLHHLDQKQAHIVMSMNTTTITTALLHREVQPSHKQWRRTFTQAKKQNPMPLEKMKQLIHGKTQLWYFKNPIIRWRFPLKLPPCLWTHASLVLGGFRGGHGKANVLGAVRAPCRHAPYGRPHAGTCIVVLGTCEMSAPLCKGFWLCHYRPYPGFLRFLSLRFLRCRLVSLTSVLKDSVSAADSSFNGTPWCVCPVLISSLSVLLEEYGPISRGAGSPDASPVSSSLSMGTIPKDD